MDQGASAPLTAAERWLSLLAVIAASFAVGVSFGVGFPLTALTLEAWGEPKWVIGLAGAAPAMATIAVLPFAPRILARLGPVWAITLGCAVAAAGFLTLSVVSSAAVWIVVRLVMSAGVAIPWLVGETWINMVARDETRGRVIACYAIAFFSGFTIGPLALGWLGVTGFAPFLAGALGTAVAGLPVLLARRLAPRIETGRSPPLLSIMRLAPAAMVGAFIAGFAEITYLSLIPNVGVAAGLHEAEALTLLSAMTAGGLIAQFPLGYLSDRVGRMPILYGLAAAFVALSIFLPVALGNAATAMITAFFIGAVILGFYSIGLAIIGERVEGSELTAVNAGYIVMYQAGAILGPLASGVAMTAAPVPGFVATVVALMAGSIIALLVLRRRATG